MSGFELRITLDADDLLGLIQQATPIRVHLSGPEGPERWLDLSEPRSVVMVPDVGIQLEASGEFYFKAAGIPLQDYIKKVRVMVRPEIDTDETGIPSLKFHIDLDEADLATFPDLVDKGITKIVDKALGADSTRLMVPFGKLLSTRGALSPRIQPLTEAKVGVERGSFTITERHVVFAVDLALTIEREGEPGEHPTA